MAAFHLRTMGTPEAVDAVAAALLQREDGALMRHELAYILGQMGNRKACPILSTIVEDEDDDVLVRHESAEALGALGDVTSIDVLQKYVNHKAPEIAETCQIAIDLIKWQEQKAANENIEKNHYYLSHDPAPPMAEKQPIADLQSALMDRSASLFHRYRAMFSLRNANNDEAALALLTGFEDESALFRHEIAFVLGQMQRPVTVDGLSNVLRNTSEHRMVRLNCVES
jgi:deoxyhypusine monooxygenase